jgi:hypothetical protein
VVNFFLNSYHRHARRDAGSLMRLPMLVISLLAAVSGAAAAQTATVVAPASMRLDLVHPAAEKITIALDRIGALNSSSFGR